MKTKEELENTYIKYSSDITKEIFDKIINKLENLGIKKYSDNSRNKEYEFFVGKDFPYLRIDAKYWFVGTFEENYKEIQVSDILGEEAKFEVGKWYKILNNWYGKFETIHNSGKRIKFSEVITNSGEYRNEGTHIDFISELQLLTDLSEIQQYLPDGHPDKLPKTIEKWSVGSYVVFCENNTNKNVLLNKPYKIINKRLNSSYINIINEAGNLSAINYTSPFYIIKWFATLPEAEAFSKSLLESDEDKPKFKIGDWVVVIPSNNPFHNYTNAIGHIFPIREGGTYYQSFIKGNPSAIDPNNTYGINYTLEDVRLATPEEIAKVTKPKTKPFEFNKWYKRIEPECSKILIFVYDDGYYGLDFDGKWFNSSHFDYSESGKERLIPATIEEVKERLLSYAKEKYPIGTKFKCIAYDKEFTVTNPNYMDNNHGFKPNDNSAIWIGVKEQCSGKIFDDKGKWAEVISKPESKVNRNVYYEVSNQEEYEEILNWLESNGEKVDRGFDVNNIWNFVYYHKDSKDWYLGCVKPDLPKAEFPFKGKSEKQSKIGDVRGSNFGMWEQMKPENIFPVENFEIRLTELKQEPRVKLINVPRI